MHTLFFAALKLHNNLLVLSGHLAVSEAQIIKLYFKGVYVIFLRSPAKSFSLQGKSKIRLSCIMMARALLVHWLVVSVFSSLVRRPSIICCLDALCVILCRESGRAVLLSGS